MPNFESPNFEQRENEINNTASFQEAISAGRLEEAAAWLEANKLSEKYDARWLDHRSREIMNAFCAAGRLEEAAKYIDYAQDQAGQDGRRAKIERLGAENE